MPATHRRAPLAAALPFAVLGSLIVATDAATAALPERCVTVDGGTGRQFVWPVGGWVSATHQYPGGAPHDGSADLGAPHLTPVRPARDGVVREAGWSDPGGWRVVVEHPAAGGYLHRTVYGQLTALGDVKAGDAVRAGDSLLGYVGRTGRADAPHLHFAIRVRAAGEPVNAERTAVIPDVSTGTWVEAGRFVPGVYCGLGSVAEPVVQPFAVTTVDDVTVHAGPDVQTDPVGTLPAGATVLVVRSTDGLYQVSADGRTLGWIPHSATATGAAPLTGVRVTAAPATVRGAPEPDGEPIGSVPAEAILTTFGHSGRWWRVQWQCDRTTTGTAAGTGDTGGCPAAGPDGFAVKYGWLNMAEAVRVDGFVARTRRAGLPVYAGRTVDGAERPDPGLQVGALTGEGTAFTVVGTWNGWYLIQAGTLTGWVAGWYTAGRQ